MNYDWKVRDRRRPLSETHHAQMDVKEFPLTSLRIPIAGLQLSESNNNKLYPQLLHAALTGPDSARYHRIFTKCGPRNKSGLRLFVVQVENRVIVAEQTRRHSRRGNRAVRGCIWVSGPVGGCYAGFAFPAVSRCACHCFISTLCQLHKPC